jgi:hypothetical protein
VWQIVDRHTSVVLPASSGVFDYASLLAFLSLLVAGSSSFAVLLPLPLLLLSSESVIVLVVHQAAVVITSVCEVPVARG